LLQYGSKCDIGTLPNLARFEILFWEVDCQNVAYLPEEMLPSYSSALKIEAEGFLETSINFYVCLKCRNHPKGPSTVIFPPIIVELVVYCVLLPSTLLLLS
jgi:hypothetical protein